MVAAWTPTRCPAKPAKPAGAAFDTRHEEVRPDVDRHEARRLFEALEEAGWQWRHDAIYAAHGSVWFFKDSPWQGDLRSLLARMEARLDRITRSQAAAAAAHADAYRKSVEDTAALVRIIRALDALRDPGGTS